MTASNQHSIALELAKGWTAKPLPKAQISPKGIRLVAEALISLEEQLEARQNLIDRFLEWDALNPPPEVMPAPFGDMHYWHSEFRRLESQAHRERHGVSIPAKSPNE